MLFSSYPPSVLSGEAAVLPGGGGPSAGNRWGLSSGPTAFLCGPTSQPLGWPPSSPSLWSVTPGWGCLGPAPAAVPASLWSALGGGLAWCRRPWPPIRVMFFAASCTDEVRALRAVRFTRGSPRSPIGQRGCPESRASLCPAWCTCSGFTVGTPSHPSPVTT